MRVALLIVLTITMIAGCAGARALELRSGSSPVPTVTIASPRSGETVMSAHVTVVGSAPPASRIVRDGNAGPDEDVIAGADGSWSIDVRLDEGANVLVFRVDDDHRSAVAMVLNYATEPSVAPDARPAPPSASRRRALRGA